MSARVLQLVLSLNPGGTERLVLEIASRLHPTMPMAVCCLDEPGAWAHRLRQSGIEVTSLGRRPGVRPGLGRAIARAAENHRATIVHAHHYSPFVYGAIARVWRPSARLIFTEHGRLSNATPSGRRRLANSLLAAAPHQVCTVSQDLKQHLVAEGFLPGHVSVIYNGIDPGAAPTPADRVRIRRTIGVNDGTLIVGTVARLDPVKDLSTLIEATGLLASESDLRLVIVGDGPEMDLLKQTAAARGLSRTVVFLGHQDNAREWLAGFDVFVNSSTSEGVSLTILEAMAAELPVVATSVGGTPEVIDTTCGTLVPARSAAAMAAAIRALAEDLPLRQRLGSAGRDRVRTRFSLERMIGAYAELYRELTGTRS